MDLATSFISSQMIGDSRLLTFRWRRPWWEPHWEWYLTPQSNSTNWRGGEASPDFLLDQCTSIIFRQHETLPLAPHLLCIHLYVWVNSLFRGGFTWTPHTVAVRSVFKRRLSRYLEEGAPGLIQIRAAMTLRTIGLLLEDLSASSAVHLPLAWCLCKMCNTCVILTVLTDDQDSLGSM